MNYKEDIPGHVPLYALCLAKGPHEAFCSIFKDTPHEEHVAYENHQPNLKELARWKDK